MCYHVSAHEITKEAVEEFIRPIDAPELFDPIYMGNAFGQPKIPVVKAELLDVLQPR